MIRAQGLTWDELDATLDRFEAQFLAAVRQVIAQMVEEIGQVRTAATEPVEPPPPGEPYVSLDDLAFLVSAWQAQIPGLIEALRVLYFRAAELVALSIALGLPEERDVPELPQRVADEYLETAANRMVNFSDELWEIARAQLVQGFERGESIEDLRDRLMSVAGLSEGRATTVARTEVISASNAGSLTLVTEAGFTGTKSWLSTEDARTRPTHILADGQTVDISDPFLVGESELLFPGDPSGAPQEIINCRCTLTYELDEEEITEDDLLALTSDGGIMADPQWEAILVVEDTPTGDQRMFSSGVLTWEDPPVPLRWQIFDQPGHDGSVIVGNITEFRRVNNAIVARGTLDAGGEYGAEAIRLIRKKMLKGISIDPDSITEADIEYRFTTDDDGFDVLDMVVYKAGRIRSAALVSIPAFVESYIKIINDDMEPIEAAGEPEDQDALTASAYVITIPDLPPARWFDEPVDVPAYGALTVTDEGRVYGSVAKSGIAHRSYQNKKVHVPMGNVDYSLFMGGETIVEGGGRVVTGVITMDCGHASHGIVDPVAAMDHYDNTCSVVARVRVGEAADGSRVWVAGAIVPGVTPEMIVKMMNCRLSGDWRPHRERNGWREFAAALLVPVPGFAESRTQASVRIEDGALVASAVPVRYEFTEKDCGCSGGAEPESVPETYDYSASVRMLQTMIGRTPEVRLAELQSLIHGG